MADFQAHQSEFFERDAEIVALSVDSEEDARTMVQKHDLGFPVMYGLDYRAQAEKLGVYTDSEREFIQPANFVLRNGRVVQLMYSEGPLGRLRAENVIQLIDFLRNQEE